MFFFHKYPLYAKLVTKRVIRSTWTFSGSLTLNIGATKGITNKYIKSSWWTAPVSTQQASVNSQSIQPKVPLILIFFAKKGNAVWLLGFTVKVLNTTYLKVCRPGSKGYWIDRHMCFCSRTRGNAWQLNAQNDVLRSQWDCRQRAK